MSSGQNSDQIVKIFLSYLSKDLALFWESTYFKFKKQYCKAKVIEDQQLYPCNETAHHLFVIRKDKIK